MRFKHEASWILLTYSLLLRCFSQYNSRTPYPIKFDRLLAIDLHGRARAVARALVDLRRGRDAHRSSAPALAPAAITECGIRPRHKCVGGGIGAAGGEVSRPERDGGGLSAGAYCRGARGAAHHCQGCVASPHCRQSSILSQLCCDHEEEQEADEGAVVFVWIWWGLVTGMQLELPPPTHSMCQLGTKQG